MSEHIADDVRQLAAFEQVLSALAFYADQDSYFAIAFLPDRPCGGFLEDFEEDHGHPDYDRAMPGKRARAALRAWSEAAHNDGTATRDGRLSGNEGEHRTEVIAPPDRHTPEES